MEKEPKPKSEALALFNELQILCWREASRYLQDEMYKPDKTLDGEWKKVDGDVLGTEVYAKGVIEHMQLARRAHDAAVKEYRRINGHEDWTKGSLA